MRRNTPRVLSAWISADHLLSDAADAAYAAQVIAAWAARYLPDSEDSRSDDVEAPGVTAVTYAGSFRTEIQAGPHRLQADEPASVGGENTGPTPYGLLSASLAACTSMTLADVRPAQEARAGRRGRSPSNTRRFTRRIVSTAKRHGRTHRPLRQNASA